MYTGYIYKITNTIDDKIYIGKTVNLEKRWYQHRRRKENKVLYKAFDKYGIKNFTFEEVISIKSKNKEILNFILNILEIFYIKKFDSYNKGYNCTLGGEGTIGRIVSEENRMNLRNSHLGHKHTEEQKEKIGAALKGRNRDHEMIIKAALKRRKPILQYSLDGEFVQEYEGPTLIEGIHAAGVIYCCKNHLVQSQGYIWKYKESEDFPLKIEVKRTFHLKGRPVYQYTKQGEFVNKYNSINEASGMTDIKSSAIRNNLSGQSKSAGGYVWSYEEKGGNV